MGRMVHRLSGWLVAVAATAGVSSPAGAAEPAKGSDPPGEEVMRPTRMMLTASPEWIEPMMRVVIEESGRIDGESLGDETKRRLAESMTRRVIDLVNAHGKPAQEFIEYFFEAAFEHDGPRNFDVATGQEFARRFLPVAGPLRGYFDAVMRDSREFATPEEAEEIEEWLGRCDRVVESTEIRMQRWAQGDVDKNGMPFDMGGFEEEAVSPEQKAQRDRQRRQRRARSRAERDLRDFLPELWPEFIRKSSRAFGFSEDQNKQAEAIRIEFLAKAQAIATAEWRQKIVANRMQSSALTGDDGSARFAPWLSRLDREFRAMIKPLDDIGVAFRAAVIGLARPEQRRAAFEATRAAAVRHGVTERELATVEAVLMRSVSERDVNDAHE